MTPMQRLNAVLAECPWLESEQVVNAPFSEAAEAQDARDARLMFNAMVGSPNRTLMPKSLHHKALAACGSNSGTGFDRFD